MTAKSCALADRGQGVPRRAHTQFATQEIAHRFVPDAMLAFSALRNTENGPLFVVWRDSVRLPSFQCGPQRSVSPSLLCRLQRCIAGRIKASGGGRVLDRLERADRYSFDLAEDASNAPKALDRMDIGSVACFGCLRIDGILVHLSRFYP